MPNSDLLKDLLAESPNRRSLLKKLSLASAATGAMMAGGGLKLSAQTSPTPTDIVQFALNLEYLEGEFYSIATTGKYLAELGIGTSGSGKSGPTTGGKQVTFSDFLHASYVAYELGEHERAHITLLRSALSSAGVTPIAKPTIDLNAAGIGFSDENSFLLLARMFEDTGLSAYAGAAQVPAFAGSPYLPTAARIIAEEAQNVAIVRIAIASIGLATTQMDGVDIIPPPSGRLYTSINDDGLCELRTPGQVLYLVFGNKQNATSGGFFPDGVNGVINTSTAPA